jgi:hypothetical protein
VGNTLTPTGVPGTSRDTAMLTYPERRFWPAMGLRRPVRVLPLGDGRGRNCRRQPIPSIRAAQGPGRVTGSAHGRAACVRGLAKL